MTFKAAPNTTFFIVDINLPGASGLDLLAKIKDESSELPVIIISADSDIETIDKAYRLGTGRLSKKAVSYQRTCHKT